MVEANQTIPLQPSFVIATLARQRACQEVRRALQAQGIKVALARIIPDVLHRAFDEHDGIFIIEKNSRIHELLAQRENFRGTRTGVLFGLMIARRQWDVFHS